jgi:hypothetical protein
MAPFASLPMHNLREIRPANARFWEALRGLIDYETEAAALGYPQLC